MRITKLGHSCLLIENKEIRILTDPGYFTFEKVKNLAPLDAVFISDEHQDHFHIESLQALLKNNQDLQVFTQKSVQALLKKEAVESKLLLDGQETILKVLKIEGCGEKHAVLHPSIPQSDNTGYIFGEIFFYPGDALTKPPHPVKILALPVAGPWLTIGEAIDYAIEVAPKICFPVHEEILKTPGSAHRLPSVVLPKHNIQFIIPGENPIEI